MFHLSVLLIFASLPCGYFSGKIQDIPFSYGEARLGDIETLCDWFCSDDLYDYDYGSELSPGPGGRSSPRIFCGLCEDKKETTTTTAASSTIKVDLSVTLPSTTTTEKSVPLPEGIPTPPEQPQETSGTPQQPPQTPAAAPQTPLQPPQTPERPPESPVQPPETPQPVGS